MPITFYLDPGQLRTIKYTDSPPISFTAPLFPGAGVAYADEQFGCLLMQTIRGDDYEICEYRAQIRSATDLFPGVVRRMLTLLYVIKGTIACHVKDAGKLLLEEGKYYVFPMPSGIKAIELKPGDYTVFQVSLSARYYPGLTKPRTEIRNFTPGNSSGGAGLLPAGLPLGMHTQIIIAEMCRCRETAIGRDMFMHGRIYDLLLLFCREAMQQRADKAPQHERPDKHAGLILQARRILDEHGGHPIHMNELCRLLGTNHRVLKTGFKQLYQKTIYAYQLELRMNIARDLLAQRKYSIYEISALLEYENPSSFIKKFKEMHDMTPLQYRKRNG